MPTREILQPYCSTSTNRYDFMLVDNVKQIESVFDTYKIESYFSVYMHTRCSYKKKLPN